MEGIASRPGKEVEILLSLPIPGHTDVLPEWLIEDIRRERMEALRDDRGRANLLREASDRELIAFLMTASLQAPLRSEYVDIYTYLCTKVMESRGIEVPEDIRTERLGKYEEEVLKELRVEVRDLTLRAMRRRGRYAKK